MKTDITLKITPEMLKDAQRNENKDLTGHLGTHFDVMNKEFPLEYTERKAVVFDVTSVKDRDIDVCDIDISKVSSDMFVVFYTGFIESEKYGTQRYFKEHPQLSNELIDILLEKNISVIGVDFAGVRRGREHTPKDMYCADKGVFIIENLCNLKSIVDLEGELVIHTYPLNCVGITGLPCRVIAEM
ncbi:MAG: cyclase family protein [Clostridia bacterium]|nr:cyclase family protein [Clostridia bacterium]